MGLVDEYGDRVIPFVTNMLERAGRGMSPL